MSRFQRCRGTATEAVRAVAPGFGGLIWWADTARTWGSMCVVMLPAACSPASTTGIPVETDLPTFEIPAGADDNPIVERQILPGSWWDIDREGAIGDHCPVVIIPVAEGESVYQAVAAFRPSMEPNLRGWVPTGGPYDAVYVLCGTPSGYEYLFVQSWSEETRTTADYYLERNSTRTVPLGYGATVAYAIRFTDRTGSYEARYLGEFEGDGW